MKIVSISVFLLFVVCFQIGFAQSQSVSPRLSGNEAPYLIDGRGKTIGRYYHMEGYFYPYGFAVMDLGSGPIALRVEPTSTPARPTELRGHNQFQWAGSSSQSFFVTPDCSGSPIIRNEVIYAPGTLPATQIRRNSIAMLYVPGRVAPAEILALSSLYTPGGCYAINNPGGLIVNGWMPASAVNLNLLFPEPLSVSFK